MATPKISTVSNPSATPTASFSGAAARTATVTTLTSEERAAARLPRLFAGAVLLSSIALGISGYLTYVAFTSSKILGCGGGVFDCDHVLHSKWSTMLGLPVAAWASSLYLSVLAALLFSARSATAAVPSQLRTWTWTLVTGAAVSAGLAALWFTGLQIFVLKHFCPWCLGAHACGLLLCISTLMLAPIAGSLKGMAAMVGSLGTLGLVTIQLLTPAPPTYTIQEFPTPSQSAPTGGPAAEPEMFDAPGEGDDILMAPDAEPSASLMPRSSTRSASSFHATVQLASMLWFSPSSLLVGQVGTTTAKPAPATPAPANAAVQDQPAQTEPAKADAPKADAAKADAGKAEPAKVDANAESKPEERTIHLSGANVKLRPNQWPIIGNPDAKYVVVELFDYTCRHCRATQQAVRGARESMKDDLAVIVLAVPLSRDCNDTVTTQHASHRESCEISKLAIAVWRVDSSKFAEFHEWLMTTEPIPTLAIAKAKAVQLVDAAALDAELAQPNASRFITRHVEIYRRLGAGPVPKLVFANTVLTGEMTSPKVLIDTIQRQPTVGK